MKIYLAIPYTGTEQQSFNTANIEAGELMKQGHIVYSPISHSHSIARVCDLPKGWDYWKQADESFIEWCDEVWVIDNGYLENSKGVRTEIEIAKRKNKPIKFLEY